MSRRMQKHKNNLKRQRKNAPKTTKLEGLGVSKCPNCDAEHDQIPLSPFNMVCMHCLRKYPRNLVMVVH